MDKEQLRCAKGIALQNALEHGGSTTPGIVISKLLGEMPELRSQASTIIADLGSITNEINAMSASDQQKLLETEYPQRKSVEPKKENKDQFPPLKGAIKGKVITRFPPEPNGYPHIGHAKAAIINEEYAKMYNGKCILRIDDTNPESERLEYYAAIKVGLEWLGIDFTIMKNTSDDMVEILKRGGGLVESGGAYVCICKRDKISEGRRKMVVCPCSKMDTSDHTERWEKMLSKYDPGQAIVRFRGDMTSQNTTMRDPTLFRIIDARHPLVADTYRVWPSYDFAVAVEDSLDGVTHAFRSKEYEMRGELYSSLLDSLKMRKPAMDVFSRLAFDGMPVSKRVIKPLIESGAISWYDDPRLSTLESMRRRGITPKAIREFVLSLGFTKTDTLAPFATLESRNRKEIDGSSPRVHMVIDPIEIYVSGLPNQSITMRNHPSIDLGERTINLDNGTLLISKNDLDKDPKMLWLIGLGNITIDKKNGTVHAKYIDDNLDSGNTRIQWIPKLGSSEITIIIPMPLFKNGAYDPQSLGEQKAFVEPNWVKLKDNVIVQFLRYGYCRKDSMTQAIFTHK